MSLEKYLNYNVLLIFFRIKFRFFKIVYKNIKNKEL